MDIFPTNPRDWQENIMDKLTFVKLLLFTI
jgi:hypothetical protein